MSITSAEFAKIVKGTASDELKQKFLDEAQDADGDLRRMLRAAQRWAQTALNPNCPSPPAADAAPTDTETAASSFRQAAFAGVEAKGLDQPVTQTDLSEVILGTASEETIVRVRNALEDPSSALSLLVGGLPAR